jgi:hypothetical protein
MAVFCVVDVVKTLQNDLGLIAIINFFLPHLVCYNQQ